MRNTPAWKALQGKVTSMPINAINRLALIRHFVTGKKNTGYCPICEKKTIFVEFGPWLRDQYKCVMCDSIPRNRALIHVLNLTYPDWRGLVIHESSPGNPASDFLAKTCINYSCSCYFEDSIPGSNRAGVRCENLQCMTFPDASFDLFITQDVLEHVLKPESAFSEIARVLKPGGAHVFTVPWYTKLKKSVRRAQEVDGRIVFLEEPVYHANPIDAKGALVTRDWGLDLADTIYDNGKLTTATFLIRDRQLGLDAEFLEVFVSRKCK